MIHAAKQNDYQFEQLWIHSMGKRFQVRAICTTDQEANEFMEHHADTALIACYGPFSLIANKYEGASVLPPITLQAILDVIDETYRRNVSSENWHSRVRNSIRAKFGVDGQTI